MQFKYLLVWASVVLCVPGAGIAGETTILEYGRAVYTLAFSPVDSSLIAAAGRANAREDNLIKIWNLRTNEEKSFRGHKDVINSVAFSPSGKLLASGSDDGTFRLWEVSQRRKKTVVKQHLINGLPTAVKAVVFSPDERRLATAGEHVKVWSVRTMKEIVAFRHSKSIWALAFSSDGRYLAVGEGDDRGPGRVRVWDFPKRKTVAVLEADSTYVTSVAFSPDNQTLASGGRQGHIKLWRVSDWQLRGTIHRAGPIYSLDFAPDGLAAGSTGSSRALSLWSAENGKRIVFLPGHDGVGVVWATAFSSDGIWLASGSDDGMVRIQNIKNHLQTAGKREVVRFIYFVPRDRIPQKDITTRIDTVVKEVQQFYAEQLEYYGHGRKTFTLETDAGGKALVHQVVGRFNDEYYREGTWTKIQNEIGPTDDKYVNVVIAEISELIDHRYCGLGAFWTGGGRALVLERCMSMGVIAHELGHAFGLEHDFRSDNDIMSFGFKHPLRISKCAAKWLDGHRFFNPDQTEFNEPTTIEMFTPLANPPRGVILRFKIDDADGLHHSQLLGPTAPNDPSDGIKLYDCKLLSAENEMIEFIIPELPADAGTGVTLRVVDTEGNFSQSTFPVEAVHIAEEHSGTPPYAVDPVGLKIEMLGQVKRTALFQNFPNPFNPETWLPYHLASDANVHIAIYDAKGALVRLMDLDWQAAGFYTDRGRAAHWDGRNNRGESVANGVYFYQLGAGDNNTQVRRMVITK